MSGTALSSCLDAMLSIRRSINNEDVDDMDEDFEVPRSEVEGTTGGQITGRMASEIVLLNSSHQMSAH